MWKPVNWNNQANQAIQCRYSGLQDQSQATQLSHQVALSKEINPRRVQADLLQTRGAGPLQCQMQISPVSNSKNYSTQKGETGVLSLTNTLLHNWATREEAKCQDSVIRGQLQYTQELEQQRFPLHQGVFTQRVSFLLKKNSTLNLNRRGSHLGAPKQDIT